ncbi:oligopeptide ABC transporter substrate-binding protein [Sporosarcina pasteurii]|uniref:Oligopeptide-binding protein AppA n=1 Tax=Sporosarcina pasteurii TaxID=1474 RepID=A0A380CJR1_SPOPA|nr:oligopeptide ABC transporter substrate-binding protein [Sporosarcina pasteurii]MDS9471902.1 oligopeptide ABC transporter substrate-binding protein [Sporosarcina pasteurii]QBQ06638.1 oligopeptide ABC transporter substrate-binding protein [Sporosarcina pasteurii]SUJ21962.1 Oligopeptide-binding protein AppA precursor [Sporosarcina pasteurii]
MKNFSKALLALMLVLVLALAACSGGDDQKDAGKEKEEGKTEQKEGAGEDAGEDAVADSPISAFDTRSETGEVEEGGTLNFGLVSDTPFEGTLNFNFYAGAPDAEVIEWFDESLLSIDEDFQYTQDGAATFEHSDDYKVFTFKIGDNVNWHDGEPVKAEDWAFSYEVIGHADYDGPRYGSDFTVIEGMEAYNAGEAEEISGIKVVDEKTLEITYTNPTPSLLAGGIWTYAMPKHIFKDIAVADMSSSDAVRKNPIGMGPFKVESIVPGESVVYSKNEDYWQGAPKLDEVVLKVVDPSVVANELSSGKIDVVDAFPADQYETNKDMEGVKFLGDVDNAYTYIGFKFGTWDKENAQVVYKPEESKVSDVALRKAMWYAVDNDAVGENFYQGLRWAGTTLIAPSHANFHDATIEAPKYDKEKAIEILTDAGYVDTDGDGFVEDPDGNELKLNFASMSGGEVAEPIANYYIQSWRDIGLDIELLDGRLQEFNTFYDRVGNGGNDDPEVDVYMGAWSVGSDVDPTGLYGPKAMFNFPRYVNEKNTELLEKGVSDEAFDVEFRQNVYKEWQQLMVEEIPVFPTLYRAVLVPVNENLLNYTIDRDDNFYRHEIGFKK